MYVMRDKAHSKFIEKRLVCDCFTGFAIHFVYKKRMNVTRKDKYTVLLENCFVVNIALMNH